MNDSYIFLLEVQERTLDEKANVLSIELNAACKELADVRRKLEQARFDATLQVHTVEQRLIRDMLYPQREKRATLKS